MFTNKIKHGKYKNKPVDSFVDELFADSNNSSKEGVTGNKGVTDSKEVKRSNNANKVTKEGVKTTKNKGVYVDTSNISTKTTTKDIVFKLFNEGYLNEEVVEMSEKSPEYEKPINIHSVRTYRSKWLKDYEGTKQFDDYKEKVKDKRNVYKGKSKTEVKEEVKEASKEIDTTSISAKSNLSNVGKIDVYANSKSNAVYEVLGSDITIKIKDFKQLSGGDLVILLNDLKSLQSKG